MSNPEADRLAADIERQREQLAGTVDALQHKLDVKAQAKTKVAGLRDQATTADGKPRPEVLGGAVAAALLVALALWRCRR